MIGARFAPNVPLAQELFWTHPMVLLGEEAQVEDCFSPFRDSGNIDARWCIVCAERTISSKIILDAPDGTPR